MEYRGASMLSNRVPRDTTPNLWAQRLAELRESGRPLIDLTEANPTRVGLSGVGQLELAALADPQGMVYDPAPRGMESARGAIARYYRERGLEVDPEHIVITASTSEAYAHLFRLLMDPGQKVLVPAPSYPLFEPLATVEGVETLVWRLVYDGRWHVDLDSIERGLDAGARALIVVQPNHPTGTGLSPEELGAIETMCGRAGAALISDEVFGDFAWPGRAKLPSLLGARRVPTFVLSGLSKVCGMPQLKLGWIALAGPEPEREKALRGLEWISDLFLSVAMPVQHALPRLLEGRHEFQSLTRTRIQSNLERLARFIARHPEVTRLEGDGGWIAILRVPARRSGEEWALELLDRGVIAHPGHFYDIEGEAYLVVSLIVQEDALERALALFESVLAEA
jgi:aspartate/methionine/tyrosine aminotransferase